jgi:hypothetical protein
MFSRPNTLAYGLLGKFSFLLPHQEQAQRNKPCTQLILKKKNKVPRTSSLSAAANQSHKTAKAHQKRVKMHGCSAG